MEHAGQAQTATGEQVVGLECLIHAGYTGRVRV